MSGLENLTAPQLLAAWADARDLRRNAVYADHPSVRARDERDGDMAMRRVERELENRINRGKAATQGEVA